MRIDPDYSGAYLILKTGDRDTGYGITVTINDKETKRGLLCCLVRPNEATAVMLLAAKTGVTACNRRLTD